MSATQFNFPVFMDWVNMAYSGSANVVLSSLSTFVYMPSGPGDLLGFNLSSFLATSQSVKTMLSISLTGCCSGCSGILVMSSRVNTDVTKLFNTLALSLSVVVRLPSFCMNCAIADLVFSLDCA